MEFSCLHAVAICAGNPNCAYRFLRCSTIGPRNPAGSHADICSKALSYSYGHLVDGLFTYCAVLCECIRIDTKCFYLNRVRVGDDAAEKICGRSRHAGDGVRNMTARTAFCGRQSEP